eukprot:gene4364-11343_t
MTRAEVEKQLEVDSCAGLDSNWGGSIFVGGGTTGGLEA